MDVETEQREYARQKRSEDVNQCQSAPRAAPEGGCTQGVLNQEFVMHELFTFHSPDPYQARQYETIRDAALHFANVIVKNTPRGPDQSAAIRKLREAVMTANAAVALRGLSF